MSALPPTSLGKADMPVRCGVSALPKAATIIRQPSASAGGSSPMGELFDVQQLTRALEHSQADILRELYTDQATMRIVDRDRPPSKPLVLTGREEIGEFWRDVCSRDMTHKVTNIIAGDDAVSFVEECLYPDGCRVL